MARHVWIVTILFIILDFLSLILDGLFYKALKDSQIGTLKEDEANELKAPVLAFVVMGSILTFMNIALVLFIRWGGKVPRHQEKMMWPFLASAFIVWVNDFPQLVIELTVAFKVHQLITVQILKAIFGLIKCLFHFIVIGCIPNDECEYEQIYDAEELENEDCNCRCCAKLIDIVGNILNFLCSFVLLVRVCLFL